MPPKVHLQRWSRRVLLMRETHSFLSMKALLTFSNRRLSNFMNAVF